MSEAVVKFNPFGSLIPSFKPQFVKLVTEKQVAQFGCEFDEETKQMVSVLKDPLDLDAQIQTFKDQCGMAQAQLLLKRGLITPEELAAKPGDYGDSSDMPDNINDAYQKAMSSAVPGVDVRKFKTDEDIQKYVESVIAAKLAAAQPQAQPNEGETK